MIILLIVGFLFGIVVMVLLWVLIVGLVKVGGVIGCLVCLCIVNVFFGKV